MSMDGKVGTEGQGHSGCLATKSFHVLSLLGANPVLGMPYQRDCPVLRILLS